MPAKRSARRRTSDAAAPTPELSQEAVITILETMPLADARMRVDDDMRRQLIATEAYFLAERRGFAAGHEYEDWLQAERLVDARLRSLHAA